MAMDEAAQSLAPEGDAPEKTPGDNAPSGDAPAIDNPSGDAPTDARTCLCNCTLLAPDTFMVFCARPYLALSKTFSYDHFPPLVTDLLLSLQLAILQRSLDTT